MEKGLSIGQVAKKIGLKAPTIRYYEQIGLIPPPGRSPASHASMGYRFFIEQDVQRPEFIKRARFLDFSLGQIEELLRSVQDGCCASARPALKALLENKLGEIDKRIEMLQALRNDLGYLQQRLVEMPEEAEAVCSCPSQGDVSVCILGDTITMWPR